MSSVHHAIATVFGLGHSPVGPGTCGALAAWPIHRALERVPSAAHLAAIVGLSAVAIECSEVVAEDLGRPDPQSIVFDETVGALLAMWFVRGRSRRALWTAWALFRGFDIVKPGPIRDAGEVKPEGVAIVLDDLAAGLAAGLLARALSRPPPRRARSAERGSTRR